MIFDQPDPRDASTRELLIQTSLRVGLIVGGAGAAQYSPMRILALVGFLALMYGLYTAGGYVGESINRLLLWSETRAYEVGR